jgi:hypothetical protein
LCKQSSPGRRDHSKFYFSSSPLLAVTFTHPTVQTSLSASQGFVFDSSQIFFLATNSEPPELKNVTLLKGVPYLTTSWSIRFFHLNHEHAI